MTFKLQSSKAIGGMVAAAVAHVQASGALVHDAAVQTVAHTEKHGDWTLLKTLMLGLKTSGFRYEGVRVWIMAHSPITFVADKSQPGGFTIKVLKEGDEKYVAWNVEGMNNTPFTSFEPSNERVGQPVYADDFIGGIMRSRARFIKLVQNTNADGSPKDATKPYYRGDIGAMLAFLTQIDAIKAPEDRAKVEDEKATLRASEQAILTPVGAAAGKIAA